MMNKTAQIIERSKKKVTLFKKVWNHCKRKINYLSPGLQYTVQDNINVGTETAAALKAQTEQMSPVVNELDSYPFLDQESFSTCKGTWFQLIGVLFMALLFLTVIGVIAIIIINVI
ncbi:hypothetical protein ACB092_09G156200 [Castanea dentata]